MENKDRKIVFFDIDGTLIDGPTHQIPQSAVEAIRKLRRKWTPGIYQYGTDVGEH